MAKRGKTNWMLIIVVAVVIVAAALGYSLYYFYSSGSAEKGIVVCDPNNASSCLWQDHVHALVIISIDGKTQNLPLQKGSLNKVHTHEETNVIHWHSSLPWNPVDNEVTDKTDFMLSNSLKSIGVGLPEGGKLFVNRNGVWSFSSDYGNFVWEDRDILFVVRDNRNNQEVMTYLETSGISLPYLGAG